MMDSGIDPKFFKGLVLLVLVVCTCGFVTFAFCGFYSLLRSEFFPLVNVWLDLAIETVVVIVGCYLGLRLVGVRGLSALAEALQEERPSQNPFAGMFD